MPDPQRPVPTAKTARLLHAAFTTGVILFAIVASFVKRTMPNADLPVGFIGGMFAVSLTMIAIGAFVLRPRVPRRSNSGSPDLFWTRAQPHAVIAWAIMDAGGTLSVVAYMVTGKDTALGIAGIAVAALLALNPAVLERA